MKTSCKKKKVKKVRKHTTPEAMYEYTDDIKASYLRTNLDSIPEGAGNLAESYREYQP